VHFQIFTFSIKPRALVSRINALFRRDSKKAMQTNAIVIGDLTIDRSSYTIKIKDKEINLPKKEFELLYFLAQNPNKIFNRDDLLQNIWGSDVLARKGLHSELSVSCKLNCLDLNQWY
jgi:two-component system, OmpR family, alkaline phosphatase synthesis response regulator PhoP